MEKKTKMKIVMKCAIAVFILMIPLAVIYYQKNSDVAGNTATRWDASGKSAHIGVFLSENAEFGEKDVMAFEEKIQERLQENNSPNNTDNRRVWADCYSSSGNISVSREDVTVEVKAIGTGGDFFLFHPLQLVSGAYYSADNLMQDLVLIDEDLAWRLYGSTDIQGQTLNIGGAEHRISGVIRREKGILNKAAGNHVPTVYLSFESLCKHGDGKFITSYEVVMPNLTKDYAYQTVNTGIDYNENICEVMEISDRYKFTSLLHVIGNWEKRSMKTNNIIYPYWENVARGREDICTSVLILAGILLPTYILYVLTKYKGFLA